jgi:3-hydroxyisobutyrate dehydrogenase-like beta-hydroxyacid dehydrogenase
MRIGFIGAGLMGHGMAANLLKAGHKLSVVAHHNRVPIDDLVGKGAIEVSSVGAIAENNDCIILCLSNAEIVNSTVERLKSQLVSGQIIIDTSTSNPETSCKLAHELETLGVAFADAPLTGGPEQASKGELGVLCGASPEIFTKIKPVLACFASVVRHMGPVGSGNTAKLISNFMVTGMIALVAESFAAARAADIDWKSLYDAMLMGSGNSGVLRKMVGPALADDFDGYRFTVENAAKDIGYFNQLGITTQLGKPVEDVFKAGLAKGLGPQNVSQILKSG